MRSAILLLFAALLAMLGAVYAKVVRQNDEPTFAFLGNASPHGQRQFGLERGGSLRTTYQVDSSYPSLVKLARLELLSKGYREVRRGAQGVTEFLKARQTVSLIQGQVTNNWHQDPVLSWSPHPERVTVVVDRIDGNPFDRTALALIAKTGVRSSSDKVWRV